jgi:outer membrane protein TolC
MSFPFRRGAAAVALACVVGGCATVDADAGFDTVRQTIQARSGQEIRWPRSVSEQQGARQRVAALLAQPLGADAAVELALLNHRGLQATLAELGISEAEIAQAGRLPNPGFSLGRFTRGGEVEIERGLHLDLARLLTLPWAAELAARQRPQVQALVALRVLTHIAETRKAWVRAVAAQETLYYRRRVLQAAEAGAELARRMAEAGNFSALQHSREQLFHAEAQAALVQAEQAQRSTRERLARLLGLSADQPAFALPERLPELPAAAPETPPEAEMERLALARLDVQAQQRTTERLAGQLGLTRRTRFVNVLELGLQHNGSNEAPTQRGWEIRLELPLFDWGEARTARAEALYTQALHRTAQAAVDARSELRDSHDRLRSSWALARHHRDALLPLRQQIAEQNRLRYNGMLASVFELLAGAREQIAAVSAALAAQRDYELARADFELALIGPPALEAAPALPDTPAATAAAAAH